MLRPVIRQSLLLTLVVSVFGTGSVATPPAGMKIWVVGDSTRIDPTRNSAFEDNLLLFPDGLSGNYRSPT